MTCKNCKKFKNQRTLGTCQEGITVSENPVCTQFEEKRRTIFDQITESPEVLAEKSVYAHECCRIPDGVTSPFIDEIFWFNDEKGDTWDERFDSAWEKAIVATVEKLKEQSK